MTLDHQATAIYDARTLQFVSAVVLKQHQNSFVTVDPTTRPPLDAPLLPPPVHCVYNLPRSVGGTPLWDEPVG